MAGVDGPRPGELDDELIARLQERAADPKRRNDAPQGITLGGAGGTMTTVFAGVASLLRGDLSGAKTSMVQELPPRATIEALFGAEQRLGFRLPHDLRRLWTEVANGGFGPGGGLLSADAAVDAYRGLRTGDELPRGRAWPPNLLPIRDDEPGFVCLDVDAGAVIDWDPERLRERSSEKTWRAAFSTVAPSLRTWLVGWLDTRPQHEVLQERINASILEQARAARASIAAKTPEERRAMGLPEVGWEKVVWGGLGLEEDPPQGSAPRAGSE